MTGAATDRQAVLARLRSALGAGEIPARAAEGCGKLAERLERPVRVALLGTDRAGREALLRGILGAAALPPGADWPTLEIVHGARARHRATLADATVLAAEGPPGGDILAQGPVFLQIAAPLSILSRMSFLHLAVGENPAAQSAALTWAARRCDIALWCTEGFTPDEARIWAAAPEALKHHALMAVQGAEPDTADRLRRPREMVAAVAVPMPGGRPSTAALVARLEAEIDAALAEDVDAARLMLHRFGLDVAEPAAGGEGQPVAGADAPQPAPAPTPTVTDAPPVAELPAAPPPKPSPVRPAPGPDRIALLSEPLLYLRRRARALHATLAWPVAEEDDWPAAVLEQCSETAEGLRDRAADWAEEDAGLADLAAFVAEAADTALLLQVEGGADRAEDAAALILQLRLAIEALLLPPATAPATQFKIAC